MSEAMPGVPAAPPPAAPRDAAAVIVYRKAREGAEVFWLRRELSLRFAGGFFAFPGGRLDAADAAIPVAHAEGLEAALVVAAARELFEETGLLKARGAHAVSQFDLDEARRALLADATTFAALLTARGLTIDAKDFTPAGRWVTPDFLPARYDARFFLVEAPEGQQAVVWPGELVDGAWVKPQDALLKWQSGQSLLHPPNLYAMRVMAHFDGHEGAAKALRRPPSCVDDISHRIEFQRGIHLFPLRTPTLPPATHTNTCVLGTEDLLVVDPGAPDETEVDRLVAFLDELAEEGCQVQAVVLTHHHGDHIGGVTRLVERLQVPVWAHPLTADKVPFEVQRLLHEGDVLALGGPFPMRFSVLHTPGHTRGHICLVDEASKAAVVGDMVAGFGTIVIDPPEGDMAAYLAQLARLKALPVGTLYPAHGPVLPEGVVKLDEYLAHRAWREGKVVAALAQAAAPTSLETLVPLAYDDVAAFVLPIAERSTLAILEKLVGEGRVVREDLRFRLA